MANPDGTLTRAGGRVVSLLGNHEVMNILGDLRDVTPEIWLTFADAQSENRRLAAWNEIATPPT